MAETRLCDCPKCHRANVVGYADSSTADLAWQGGGAAYGATVGTLFAPGAGTIAGAIVGGLVGKALANGTKEARVPFNFSCPACGHEWTKNYQIKSK